MYMESGGPYGFAWMSKMKHMPMSVGRTDFKGIRELSEAQYLKGIVSRVVVMLSPPIAGG